MGWENGEGGDGRRRRVRGTTGGQDEQGGRTEGERERRRKRTEGERRRDVRREEQIKEEGRIEEETY